MLAWIRHAPHMKFNSPRRYSRIAAGSGRARRPNVDYSHVPGGAFHNEPVITALRKTLPIGLSYQVAIPHKLARQAEGRPALEIKVLGSLEAYENGISVVPSAAKPRQVLALLALNAGQVVPVPWLIEELWGMSPPRSALGTLQIYVLHLRRLIDAARPGVRPGLAKEILVTRYGGYALLLPPSAIDVQVFDERAAAGERALVASDYPQAARLLRSALSLWRGEPLVDVQAGMRLSVEISRLEESRLAALESRIDVDLKLGRHHALLSELTALTSMHPMNEDLHARFMIALCRSGRRWRALEVFRSLRDTLVHELGVEPSAQLCQLQMDILNAEPGIGDNRERAVLRVMS
jgi:SARP family transcriptional regulator, regulator of embCAB operon